MEFAPLADIPEIAFLVVVFITLYLFIHYKWVLFLVPKVFARNNLTFLKWYFVLKDRLLHICLVKNRRMNILNFISIYIKVSSWFTFNDYIG